MLVTWVLSRTTGIGFIPGLEDVEAVTFPDAVAVAFEMIVVCSVFVLLRPAKAISAPRGVMSAVLVPVAVAFLVLGGPAVYAGATLDHDHSQAGHSHAGKSQVAAEGGAVETGSVHDHSAPIASDAP